MRFFHSQQFIRNLASDYSAYQWQEHEAQTELGKLVSLRRCLRSHLHKNEAFKDVSGLLFSTVSCFPLLLPTGHWPRRKRVREWSELFQATFLRWGTQHTQAWITESCFILNWWTDTGIINKTSRQFGIFQLCKQSTSFHDSTDWKVLCLHSWWRIFSWKEKQILVLNHCAVAVFISYTFTVFNMNVFIPV